MAKLRIFLNPSPPPFPGGWKLALAPPTRRLCTEYYFFSPLIKDEKLKKSMHIAKNA